EYRFGKSWGGQAARVISAIAVIVSTIGMLTYLMKALGLFIAMFVPFSPAQCVLVMVLIAALYTAVSGFFGVVYTDLFQSLIVISAIIFISVIAVDKIAGAGNIAAMAVNVTGNDQWANSSLPLTVTMPREYGAYQDLLILAIFYFLRNMLVGISSAGADPRYFGARNERECGTLTFLWTSLMMFRWLMMMGFAVLGIILVHDAFPDQSVLIAAADYIKMHFHNISRADWPDLISNIMNNPAHFRPDFIGGLRGLLQNDWQSKLSLLSYDGTVNPEKIVPAVILIDLPAGARGFLLIAFVAAAFSSFNSSANSAAAYFTRDLYQRFFHSTAKTKELIGVSYLFICSMALIAYIFAYDFRSITQIWGWIAMGLGGGLAIPAVLKFYWWRYNGGGFAIGTSVGIIASIAEISLFPHLLEWQQFVLVASISLVATIVGTLLTSPVEDDVAFNFYRTTRPFGFWQPFKTRLDPGIRKAMEREHRNDLTAIPFTLGWQISLFLLPMQLMIGNYRQSYFTLGVFLFCITGMYFFWYRNLPPGESSGKIVQQKPVYEQITEDSINNPSS
ncbi:MAG: sodium:solute symporter, partial [Candidatus Kryptoniota bacterium]